MQHLERALAPHLHTARERDPHFGMLDSSPSSDDDGIDDELSGSSEGEAEGASSHGAAAQASSGQRMAPLHGQQAQRKQRVVFSVSDVGSAAYDFASEQAPLPTGESGLTALLKGSGAVATVGSAVAAESGPMAKIRVHGIPGTKGAVELAVARNTTFTQVLARAAAHGRAADGQPVCTAAYEIFMADEDGEPDDDIVPPRDKSAIDFGNEFALRRLPAAKAKAAEAAAAAEVATTVPSARVMRVHLPREAFGQRLEQWMITQPYRDDLILADLMVEVCRKRGVRLHPAKHVFTIPSGGRPINGKPLDMGARLGALELPRNEANVPEIAVIPRAYADAPPPPKRTDLSSRGGWGADASLGGAQASMPPEPKVAATVDFVFSDVTAAQYKEYRVTKINKRGARQQRVLGIDRERFYNLSHSREDGQVASSFRDGALKFVGLRQVNGGTKVPFRPMRDAIDAHCVEGEPRAIVVIFKDVQGTKAHKYEAESPTEAAEIVAKLNYLMDMHGGSRTVRLKDAALDISPASASSGGLPAIITGGRP